MRRSSLVQLICADALRASIRVVGLFAEVRPAALSVPRGLLGANAVAGLRREFDRLQGLGDLLVPVSTFAEVDARNRRLQQLASVLPEWPDLRLAAERVDLGESPPAVNLTPTARGDLLAADEMNLQALDERLRRAFSQTGAPADDSVAGQLRAAVGLVHAESASWRGLEDSRLANRLIADRGFVESFGQARKRARAFIKAQASNGRTRLKLAQLRDLLRWHRSVAVQFEVLAQGRALPGELGELQRSLVELDAELESLVLFTRLRRVTLKGKNYDEILGAATDRLPGALQRGYGVGKSNFRALIESELA